MNSGRLFQTVSRFLLRVSGTAACFWAEKAGFHPYGELYGSRAASRVVSSAGNTSGHYKRGHQTGAQKSRPSDHNILPLAPARAGEGEPGRKRARGLYSPIWELEKLFDFDWERE